MIAFDPTEEQKLMQESVAQFARHTLRPQLRAFERARELPEAVRRTAHELGLGLLSLPESVGGPGLGLLTAALLEEEVAFGDPGAAYGFGGPGAFGRAALELGSAEQGERWLRPYTAEGGHDRFGALAWGERKANKERPGLSTVARRSGDHWTLDGEKAFVAQADRASDFIVIAATDPAAGWDGWGAFFVPKGARGLTIGARETTLGLDVGSFGSLRLEGVSVPLADRLDKSGDAAALLRVFAKEALLVAARCVGLSRAAFETTKEYCESRRAFGKPIGHFQAIAFTLADRAIDLEASRIMVWRAANTWDAGEKEHRALLQTAYAISYAQEAAMRCGDDAVQLHGGAGFMRDYPVEKWMRDAKQLQLCVMTAEQADQLAAAIETRAPLSIGQVLPHAESQSTFL
jgi:alkylation response protein AidB-like acyl-CoA dehydrogenase